MIRRNSLTNWKFYIYIYIYNLLLSDDLFFSCVLSFWWFVVGPTNIGPRLARLWQLQCSRRGWRIRFVWGFAWGDGLVWHHSFFWHKSLPIGCEEWGRCPVYEDKPNPWLDSFNLPFWGIVVQDPQEWECCSHSILLIKEPLGTLALSLILGH